MSRKASSRGASETQVDAGGDDDDNVTDDAALGARVVRKIDWLLIPLLFTTYNLNFVDKTILSNASVFGLREGNGLHGTQYSWVSSVFYFGYLFWSYPTSLLIQRLPIGKYVGINTLFWGVIVALTAACHSFRGLMTVRFFLGVAEATISPAFLFITSSWYTRAEIPTRVGIWFAGNSLGGVFASFISYGIGHITHPLQPWQWLFIVLGIATFLWGIPLLMLLPDSVSKARFLSEEERECAVRRVQRDGTGAVESTWKKDQFVECLLDPKTYGFAALSLLTQIPNGGTQNFGNLVLRGFGFTSLETTLVTLPASVIAFSTIFATGRLAGKFPNSSLILICATVLFPVVGSAIIYSATPSKGLKLFGYYLLATGPGALPLSMSLVSVNFKGSTKKMTMTAILFLAYCVGNIAGPQFFKERDAPHYVPAFEAILVCYALVVLVAMLLRLYLTWENQRRDEIAVSGIVTAEFGDEGAETTDRSAREFRYRM